MGSYLLIYLFIRTANRQPTNQHIQAEYVVLWEFCSEQRLSKITHGRLNSWLSRKSILQTNIHLQCCINFQLIFFCVFLQNSDGDGELCCLYLPLYQGRAGWSQFMDLKIKLEIKGMSRLIFHFLALSVWLNDFGQMIELICTSLLICIVDNSYAVILLSTSNYPASIKFLIKTCNNYYW